MISKPRRLFARFSTAGAIALGFAAAAACHMYPGSAVMTVGLLAVALIALIIRCEHLVTLSFAAREASDSERLRSHEASGANVAERTAALTTAIEQLRREVEERQQIEQELRAAMATAESASRSKSLFLANMSHEIRTPMNGILGMLELLLGTTLDEVQRNYLRTSYASAESLLRVLSDILDFSKIEAGKLELEQTRFALRPLIEQVLQLVHKHAEEKAIEIQCHIESDVPDHVMGDPVRVRQVLTNLLTNAVKFTARGEISVVVSTERDPEVVEGEAPLYRFDVSDTGIGLTDEQRTRIFSAFSQGDQSTTRMYGGTGLGLAIAKQLVQLMGGTIDVKSRVGRGSTFSFTAQLGECIQGSAEAFDDLFEPGWSEAEPIEAFVLVVEDNAINRTVAARMLERFGVTVLSARDGAEAVAMAVAHQFDLILMDCQMPVMDGYEATARIRAFEQSQGDSSVRIPIVALTANAMDGDRERCLAAGMDDYIRKPFKMAELARTLRRWGKTRATESET